MRYFFTYHYYYDCPTCDGHDNETSMSQQYDSLFELIIDLKNHISEALFLNLHSIDEEGNIELVAPIHYSTGWHSIIRVETTVNSYTYAWDTFHKTKEFTLTSDDPNFNLIYGK